MNNRRVELTDIRPMVEEAVNENPESSAVVVSDQESPTGVVIDIMDQIRAGGVISISIAAEPDST
jgi:biopolymer transport protein ExbD